MRALYCGAIGIILAGALAWHRTGYSLPPAGNDAKPAHADRSPVDFALSADEKWLWTVNQTSSSVSLIDVASGKTVSEMACGQRPSAIALLGDGGALVTSTFSHELFFLDRKDGQLHSTGSLRLGFEPRGVAVSPDGKRAYVALTTAHQIAVVDIEIQKEIQRIDVGRWPRYLALSGDGKRLAVGANGDGGVSVVDTAQGKMIFDDRFGGINFGQMQVDAAGKYAYVPWMVYRASPITQNNIRIGWVLASRIARLRLDEHHRREAISLDPRGLAVADPHGIALSPKEDWLVFAASGTQELLVYQMAGLPWQDYGGPGDHIDVKLLNDKQRHFRIPLGGRPMFARFAKNNDHVYVANYLLNAMQIVSVSERKIVRTITLGGPEEPTLARKGEALFYDGRRSLDQWYSCHSCHYEGHVNAPTMDTRNDGRFGNYKMVLSLRNVTQTSPWTWHGWQKDFDDAMKKSFTETMLGPAPNKDEVKAIRAFLGTLTVPPNPHRLPDGSLTESAKRGEKIFKTDKANCVKCHSGPYFTDGRIHDVGTNERGDVYKGYNPPSLLGVYDRMRFLHDGRAATLEETLRGPHNPDRVTGRGKLSDDDMRDLLEYVKSL